MASLRHHHVVDERWSAEQPALTLSRVEVGRDQPPARDDQLERLTRTIENEIIPRLLLLHGAVRTVARATEADGVAWQSGDNEAFTQLLLTSDLSAARRFVEGLWERGVTVETILLDLLAPAARHLGELWQQDRCNFVDVTLGLSMLQQLLRDLSPFFCEGRCSSPESGQRILLVPAPGEQHTFGLHVVEEFFRRAGWDVCVESPRTANGVVELISGMWFAVVGLSVSRGQLLNGLAPVIRSIRRNSLNRAIGVMVGGQALQETPSLVARIGADATAKDAREAVSNARALVELARRLH